MCPLVSLFIQFNFSPLPGLLNWIMAMSYQAHAQYNTGFQVSANVIFSSAPQPSVRSIDRKSIDAHVLGVLFFCP